MRAYAKKSDEWYFRFSGIIVWIMSYLMIYLKDYLYNLISFFRYNMPKYDIEILIVAMSVFVNINKHVLTSQKKDAGMLF
jgi:hypothetical protein